MLKKLSNINKKYQQEKSQPKHSQKNICTFYKLIGACFGNTFQQNKKAKWND